MRTRLALAALALPLLLAPPAHASCAARDLAELARSPEVVLARVLDQRRAEATLAVEEVWQGADRPPELVVRTGQREWGSASSIDVRLVEGQRYVVVLLGDEPATSACDAVEAPRGGELARLRPPGARPPVPAGGEVGSLPVLAGSAGLGALVLVGALARRSRLRRPGRARRSG